MGIIRPPKRVKLFVGMIGNDRDLMKRAGQLLRKDHGDVDIESDYWPFEHTEYYHDEMGENLERHFLAFSRLIHPEALADIKRDTNDLEQRLGEDLALPAGCRPINLDPGYMSLSKLVLATTKDYAHRIYLRRGVFAEVTLHFHGGSWQPWPWTYPDYASDEYREFFVHMRDLLKAQFSRDTSAEDGANDRA